MIELRVHEPKIFDKTSIKAGITKMNLELFPPYGFSVSRAELWNDKEVEQNRNILAENLNIDHVNLVFNKQTHSDIIHIADKNKRNREGDALVTNIPGLAIAVSIADCAGILLFDNQKGAVAAVHSGWRGTSRRILTNTLNFFSKEYGSDMSEIRAFISPCAGGASYEVGEDVAALFPESVVKTHSGKYFFENKNELRNELTDVGVKPENIEISPVDTITDLDYHSYRRDKKQSGRMAAFIMII